MKIKEIIIYAFKYLNSMIKELRQNIILYYLHNQSQFYTILCGLRHKNKNTENANGNVCTATRDLNFSMESF